MIPSEVVEETQTGEQISRFERYRDRADPAIAVVSAFYLVLLLTPRVAITSLESSRGIFAADIVFWGILVGDTAWRIWITTNRRQRWYRIFALMLLLTGPLVLFQVSETTRYLVRLALISVAAFRAVNSFRFFFRLRSILYIGSAVFLIVLAFGVSMTATERQYSHSNIRSLSDGLWWAVSTVSTVGYGDKFPVSNPGRVIATGLMFIGVALFSILTATLANSFAARSEGNTSTQIQGIHEKLDRIERQQKKANTSRRARAPQRPRRTTPPPRTGSVEATPEE
jgi:voltage-gated potassium channel